MKLITELNNKNVFVFNENKYLNTSDDIIWWPDVDGVFHWGAFPFRNQLDEVAKKVNLESFDFSISILLKLDPDHYDDDLNLESNSDIEISSDGVSLLIDQDSGYDVAFVDSNKSDYYKIDEMEIDLLNKTITITL